MSSRPGAQNIQKGCDVHLDLDFIDSLQGRYLVLVNCSTFGLTPYELIPEPFSAVEDLCIIP